MARVCHEAALTITTFFPSFSPFLYRLAISVAPTPSPPTPSAITQLLTSVHPAPVGLLAPLIGWEKKGAWPSGTLMTLTPPTKPQFSAFIMMILFTVVCFSLWNPRILYLIYTKTLSLLIFFTLVRTNQRKQTERLTVPCERSKVTVGREGAIWRFHQCLAIN